MFKIQSVNTRFLIQFRSSLRTFVYGAGILFFSALAFADGIQGKSLKIVQDNGIEFLASPEVSDEAFKRAQYVVNQMLSNAPAIRAKMQAIGFKVEIIGKNQVLTDLSDYSYLKGKKTFDGRDYDLGTRGLGGPEMCSIGEENLLCLSKQHYWQEDILVHEFSHSMKYQMDKSLSDAIDAAYKRAMDQLLYDKKIYMAASSQEYWAEGTQAWFGVTLRSDVNGGFNTAQKLSSHDPDLAASLEKVFGSTKIDHFSGCAY